MAKTIMLPVSQKLAKRIKKEKEALIEIEKNKKRKKKKRITLAVACDSLLEKLR